MFPPPGYQGYLMKGSKLISSGGRNPVDLG